MSLDVATRPRSANRLLLMSEAGGGMVVMASAALSLIVANSPLRNLLGDAGASPWRPLSAPPPPIPMSMIGSGRLSHL